MADEIKGENMFDVGSIKTAINSIIADMDKLNLSLEDAARIAKDELSAALKNISKIKFTDSKSIQEFEKAQQAAQKTIQETIKVEKEKVALSEKQIRLQKLVTAETEREIKSKEKAAKASSDLSNLYKVESAQLNKLRNDYKNLAAQGLQYTSTAQAMKVQIDALDKKLKDIDDSVGQNTREVGSYKKALRELMQELSTLEGDEFIAAAEKAGVLKDKIDDANQAARELASGSKFEQAENSLGAVGQKLADMDFEGAAEKSEQFSKVIKSIKFEDVIAGVKGFGTAVANVTRSLLANPIILFAAAIAGLVYIMYQAFQTSKYLNTELESTKKVVESGAEKFKELTRQIEKYQIKLKETAGIISKSQSEQLSLEAEHRNDVKDIYAQRLKDIITLRKEISDHEGIVLNNQGTYLNVVGIEQTNLQEKFLKEKLKIEESYNKELFKLNERQAIERNELNVKQFKEDLEKQAEKNKEKKDKEAELYKDLLKLEADYREKLKDLQIAVIKDDQERDQSELIETFNREKIKADKEIKNKDLHDEYIKALSIKLREDLIKIDEKYLKEAADQEAAFRKKREETIKFANDKFKDEEQRRVAALESLQQDYRNLEIEMLNRQIEKKKGNSQKEVEDLKELLKKTYDLRKKDLEEKAELEKSKEGTLPEEKFAIEEKLKIDVLRLELDKQKQLDDIDKAAKEKRYELAKTYVNKSLDLVQKEVEKTFQLKQQQLDNEISATQTNIQLQQQLAATGQDNQLAFEKAQLAKEQQQKADLKKKEIKTAKEIAMLKLLAGYAENGNPSEALKKAAIDIALEGVIAGAFKGGVENLQGPGTETSDSILARLSKGESVIKASATAENPGLATALNTGMFSDYVEKNILPNYMMNFGAVKPSPVTNDGVLISALEKNNKEIAELKEIIRNKPEPKFYFDKLGNMIMEIKRGSQIEITNYLNSTKRI